MLIPSPHTAAPPTLPSSSRGSSNAPGMHAVPRFSPSRGSADKIGSPMAGKRPRPVPSTNAVMEGLRWQVETPAKTSQDQVEKKITVTINAKLLQCSVCHDPLTPPLFQCTQGHISCSKCCADDNVNQDGDAECLMCRGPATATRCHGVEHLLAGLRVPCPFAQFGCPELAIPYAAAQAHRASCAYAPFHCPISGCEGYAAVKPLREHVCQDHPDVQRTVVSPRVLTALTMRADERARVVGLAGGAGGGAEFLLVVGEYKKLGRALSVVRLVDEDEYCYSMEEVDFKHRIEVVGKAGVLSLSGETVDAERLEEPYEASPFLFVPNETWDAPGDEGNRVLIELK